MYGDPVAIFFSAQLLDGFHLLFIDDGCIAQSAEVFGHIENGRLRGAVSEGGELRRGRNAASRP